MNNDGDMTDAGEGSDDRTPSADVDDFMISGDGVLTFKFSPNYEIRDTEYEVVVVASDDALGVMGRENTYKKVTVTVTDVDEDGSISLSAQQPQVDVALTATLTDQDRSATKPIIDATWKWEQAQAMNGPWSLISGAGTDATDADTDTKASDGYKPAADTVGKYLRATVTYTDEHGDDKTAMAVSAHAVRAGADWYELRPHLPD